MADQIKIEIDVAAKDAIKELLHVQKWTQEVAAAAKKATEEETKFAEALRKAELDKYAAATKLAAEETKKLAAESTALGASIEKLRGGIDSTREATAKLKAQNDAADASAREMRSTFVTLTTDVGKLGDRFERTSPVMFAFAGTVSRVTAGVAAGVGALGAATMSLAQHAAASENNERAARLLGDAYGQVQDATMGTVNAQTALRVQQGLVQSGLEVSGSQLAVVTRAARDYALATGTETGQALDQMADALRGMEAEGLRRFNISVTSSGDRTRDFSAAVEQLSQRQARSTVENRTMSEEITRSTDAMGRFIGSLAAGISRALELRQAFSWAADLLDPEVQRRNLQGDSLLRAAAERARQRGSTLARIQEAERAGLDTSQLRAAMSTRGVSLEDMSRIGAFAAEGARRTVSGGAGAVAQQQAVLGEAITPALRAQMQLTLDAQNISDASRAKAGESARAADRLTKATDGAAASLTVFERVSQRIAGMMQRAQSRSFAGRAGITSLGADEFGDMLGEIAAPRSDELALLENERGKSEAAFAEDRAGTTRERERTQRRAARDRETRRMAMEESPQGRISKMFGLERDEGGSLKAFDAADEGLKLMEKSIAPLRSGFADMWTSIADGSKSAGDAMEDFAAKSLSALGQIAIQEGSVMLFKAIPAAFENPPLAIAYGLGGAGLIALGMGLTAAGTAVAAPPTPPAGAGASGTQSARGLAPRSLMAGSSGSLGNITIVNSSLVPSGPVDAQRARDGLRTVRRQGFGDRAPRRIEH